MTRFISGGLRVAAFTFAFLVATVSLSIAAYSAPNFHVINEGSHTINTLNVSPHASGDWGSDLLGQYELAPGHYASPLAGYTLPECVQDVRVIYDNGAVDYFYNLNVCTLNVTFHY